MQTNLNKRRKGFTLIELIIVMAVIGIILLMTVPLFGNWMNDSKLTHIRYEAKAMEHSVEEYLTLNPDFKSSELESIDIGPYIDSLLVFDKYGQVNEVEDSNYFNITDNRMLQDQRTTEDYLYVVDKDFNLAIIRDEAIFKESTYTVKVNFIIDDGEVKAPEQVVVAGLANGDDYEVTTPEIDGYTPNTSEVSGTINKSNVEETVTYSKTRYSVTVNYIVEGNESIGPESQTVENLIAGDSYSIDSPVVTGYTPGSPTISGTIVDSSVVETVTYTTAAFLVDFDSNGGDAVTDILIVNYLDAYGELPTPTREGYTFTGWSNEATGGDIIESTSTMDETSNHTLFAQWEYIPFEYVNHGSYIEITGYDTAASRDMIIPDTIEGLPVTHIGVSAFEIGGSDADILKITSVTIPNTVTTIRDSAFYNNALSSLSLPNSVVHIEDWAFSNNSLTELILPENISTMGRNLFSNNLISSIIIPDGMEEIGESMFSNNSLTTVTLPNSITTIKDYAFSGNDLQSLLIPTGLTSIGQRSFSNNELTTLVIPNNVNSMGPDAFRSNKLTSVVISGSLTSIPSGAFSYNELSSVTIPDSILSIGQLAFWNNEISELNIGNSVTMIGIQAFENNLLPVVVIPDSVISIGNGAFNNNGPTKDSSSIPVTDFTGTWEINGTTWVKVTDPTG